MATKQILNTTKLIGEFLIALSLLAILIIMDYNLFKFFNITLFFYFQMTGIVFYIASRIVEEMSSEKLDQFLGEGLSAVFTKDPMLMTEQEKDFERHLRSVAKTYRNDKQNESEKL